jgi:uncharacterized protein YndB with AHSA1/START domain
MAADRFTHRVKVDVPPDQAWVTLQDPETWGLITGVERVYDARHSADGTLRSYRFTVNAGGRRYEATAETHDADAPHLMAITIDAADVQGTITVELAPSNPGGTEMTASLKMRPKGLLSMVIFPIISGAVSSGFTGTIDDIAARMEQAQG